MAMEKKKYMIMNLIKKKKWYIWKTKITTVSLCFISERKQYLLLYTRTSLIHKLFQQHRKLRVTGRERKGKKNFITNRADCRTERFDFMKQHWLILRDSNDGLISYFHPHHESFTGLNVN